MNLSVTQALSMIKPADTAAERYAREQARLERFKGMYEADTQRKAEQEAIMGETLGATDALLDNLSPRGQEEMQSVINENKKQLEDELKKWGGDVDQFMRHGGTAMLSKYKTAIQGDQRYRNHLKASGHIAELQEVMKAGKGNMISYSTQKDLAKYQAGLIDTFEPKLINPIEIPEDKYYENVPIALRSIVGENYQAFRTNYMVEHPGQEPTFERLMAYADTYYGEALGKKIDEMKRIKARTSGRSKSSKQNQIKPEDYTFSRNTTSAFIKGIESNSIGLGKDALRNYWINGGHNLSTNFDLDGQYKWRETETGNHLQESYEMTKASAGSLFNAWVQNANYVTSEDGKVQIPIADLYDEYGVKGGGQQTYDHMIEEGKTGIEGEFMGVFLTKGNKNAVVQGKTESVLYMENENEDKNSEAIKGYQNKEGEDPGGRPMMVAAVKDADSGEIFYMEIPAERADVTGLMNETWGKKDNLGDDVQQNARERNVEAAYKEEDAARTAAAVNLYKSDLVTIIDDDLNAKGLEIGHNIYGGLVAGMTASFMSSQKEYSGLSGDDYDAAFTKEFADIHEYVKQNLFRSGSELKQELLLASDDGKAREVFMKWLAQDSPEEYQTLRKWCTKYMNNFKA